MNLFKLRITNIDFYGYCDRDMHPSQEDVGKVVTPIGMVAILTDEAGQEVEAMKDTYHPTPGVEENNALIWKEMVEPPLNVLQRAWTCVTTDGKLLTLMDHEVEIVENPEEIVANQKI